MEYPSRDKLLNNPGTPTEALHSAVQWPSGDRHCDRIILKGSTSDHSYLHQGCVFQDRCKYVEARCRKGELELKQMSPGHFTDCHLAEKLDLIELKS